MKLRWRFSLRSLLVGFTLAALLCGWLAITLERKQAEREALAHFTSVSVGAGPLEGPDCPSWLAAMVGEDFFQHLRGLQLWGVGRTTLAKAADIRWAETIHFMEDRPGEQPLVRPDDFAAFADLRRVRQFQFEGPYDDRIFQFLQRPQLERLVLTHTRIDGSGLRWLDPSRLQILTLADSPVGDVQLAKLARFSKLRALLLEDLPITGAGLAELGTLKNLEILCLINLKLAEDSLGELPRMPLRTLMVKDVPLGDAAIARLADCLMLENLSLIDTLVTDGAARELASALSNCRFHLERRYHTVKNIGRAAPRCFYDRVFYGHPQHERCDEMLDLDRVAFSTYP